MEASISPEVVTPSIESTDRPEGERKPTPNLIKFQYAALQYHWAEKAPENITRDNLDEAIFPYRLKSTDFVSPGGAVQIPVIGSFLKQLDDPERIRSRIEKISQLSTGAVARLDPQETSGELKALVFLNQFLVNSLSSDQDQNAQIFQSLNERIQQLKSKTLVLLSGYGAALLAEDAVLESGLPHSDRGGRLNKDIANLAVINADPRLRQAYQKILDSVTPKEFLLRQDQIRSWGDFVPEGLDLQGAVDRIINSLKKDEWEALQATPEQAHKLYDLVSEEFFRTLYAGGYESWPGTEAAMGFNLMRDPRAIPGLLEHLRRFRSGHTSNSVAYVLRDIIQNPLAQEELTSVIEQSSPTDRRIITEWFQDPDSVFNLMDGYQQADLIKDPEKHFAYGEVATLAKRLADAKGIELKSGYINNPYVNFFFGYFDALWPGRDQIESLLADNLEEVAAIIIKSKSANWKAVLPSVFSRLVNPSNGEYFAFPKRIAQEGMGLNEEFIKKLEAIYNSKDLQRGVVARSAFAEGLLLLGSKEDGREITEAILTASTGANRDPERIREIFRALSVLDAFGRFSFTPKRSLLEISQDLRGQVVSTVREKMELTEQEMPALGSRLDYLLDNNLIEIIPALIAKAEQSEHDNVARVVREIGRHIVLGDFQQWRNGLSTGLEQLAILPEDRQANWLQPAAPVTVIMEAQSDREARTSAAEAIKRIALEAKAHIQDVYKLDFSLSRLQQLHIVQSELLEEMKRTEKGEDKRELGVRKNSIDNEVRVLEGMLALESLDPQSVDPQKILEVVAKTKNAMTRFQGLEQPVQDLDQIEKVLITQQKLSTVMTLRAYDSDDPVALLNAGTQPRETCQSWRDGSYNYCLPAYVTDANKRVLNVENERGEIMARSMAKLTQIKTETGQTMPAILLEPVYTTSETSYVYRAIIRLALAKAKATGAALIVTSEVIVPSHADQTKTVAILPQEAEKAGFTLEQKAVEVFIPQSHNPFEYSDTLGGVISYFNNYRSLADAVVAKAA